MAAVLISMHETQPERSARLSLLGHATPVQLPRDTTPPFPLTVLN